MQRMARANKQKMWYSLYHLGDITYETDSDENIVYIGVDGEFVPVEVGRRPPGFDSPVLFEAVITMSGGEAEAAEFGLDFTAYSAVMQTTKNELPIDETSRIWCESEPVYNDDGTVDGDSADYIVKKVSQTLNFSRYALAKRA